MQFLGGGAAATRRRCTRGGARTLDHKIKSLALCRLSYPGWIDRRDDRVIRISLPVGTRLIHWATKTEEPLVVTPDLGPGTEPRMVGAGANPRRDSNPQSRATYVGCVRCDRRFRSSDLWVMGPARFLCAMSHVAACLLKLSRAGNRTPVLSVTAIDTNHYTTRDARRQESALRTAASAGNRTRGESMATIHFTTKPLMPRCARKRRRRPPASAIVRSATELSTQEPSDAPLAQGRPGIEPGTIRKLRQKEAGRAPVRGGGV